MAETVLDRVQKARRFAGKSDKQVDIAKVAGVSQASVSEWRFNKISLDSARLIGADTGTCVEWLMTGRGPMTPGEALPPELQELVAAWPQLDEAARSAIYGFAHGHIAYSRVTAFRGDPERREAVHDRIAGYQARNHKKPPSKPTGRRKAKSKPKPRK